MSVHSVMYPLLRASRLFPGRQVVGFDGRVGYGEMVERVYRVAGFLRDRGVGRGDVVAVLDVNSVRFMEIAYAAGLLEAVFMPVNFRLPPVTIAEIVGEVRPRVLFYSEPFKGLADNLDVGFKFELERYGEILSGGSVYRVESVDPEAPYALLYTSGTTGKPKAVLYSQSKMVAGALSIAHQLALYDTPAKLGSGDVMLSLIPVFHILSWGSIFIAPFVGAKLVFVPKMDSEYLAGVIKREGVTWMNGVPTMIYMLLESGERFDGFKALIGGSTVPISLAEKMKRAGMVYSTIYGATDMLATSISIVTDHTSAEEARQVTHPVPYAEVKIVKEDGSLAAPGELGEIWYRSPWMPDGYHNNPEKTRESFVEGWFRTGDLGEPTVDSGLKVLDRVKDAIKSGGEWIPSSVLESIASEVEGVEMVAAVPVRHEKWGERPVLVYVGDVGEEPIRKHFMESVEDGRIAKFWIPDRFLRVEELPLTSTGKIHKMQIRELVKKMLGLE